MTAEQMTDTDTRNDIASLTERTRAVNAGAPIVGVHFLGDTPVFVLGEEALFFAPREGEPRRVAVHEGGILESKSDGTRIITGGDDGKVAATKADGSSEVIATDPKHRWIDHVALGPDGAVAWSAGKQAFVRPGKGEERSVEVPSTVGALAFLPKGFRLAIAHYNGVSLWFPNAKEAKPEVLEWKGSHLGILFSPDGRFLVTAMQEPTLHGWRIMDGKHMRMSGYAARVRSFDWTVGAKWLATSGSTQLILWPFQTKDGPMGKQPKLLAPTQHRVEVVASHPKQEVVAVGYADGMALLVRVDDGAEILLKHPGQAPVTALAWDKAGSTIAWGAEDGSAGVVVL
jgi:WD40 repeat protein